MTLLGNRDKEEKDKREALRTSYAKELRSQMQEQHDANVRRFNEMDERERKLNVHGLAAYEAAEAKANTKTIPGFEVDKTFDKEDFKRVSAKNSINFGKKVTAGVGPAPTRSLTSQSIGDPSRMSPDRVKHY